MPTTVSQIRPIQTVPGVQPSTDQTPWNTEHYILTQGVRFRNDSPEKIGGFISRSFDMDNELSGVPRSVYSQQINGRSYTMIGTHTRLYSLIGSQLVNITPLDPDADVVIGSNLKTDYVTLANNPITTVNGSMELRFAKTDASRYQPGDLATISGATTTNGVLNTDINGIKIVRSVGSGFFTIQVPTPATSSGTGGGAVVLVRTGLLQATSTAHNLIDGDRVKLHDAATFGGVTDVQINKEWLIRYVDANTFDFFTGGVATSSVTGSGVSTGYYPQIAAGIINVQSGSGYGAGLYGVGLYGTALVSSTGFSYPRIWCFDRYGDFILCSPGNQGKLYEWDGDTAEAPVQVSGSPDNINWFFVSNNIIVTLGALGTENRIKTSDQSDRTNWTASAQNQVYDDNIEGAGRFISQMNVGGTNLLFTDKQVYTFEYIGFDSGTAANVWKYRLLGVDCGIVGPLSRVEVNGIGYWMGQQNLYFYRGGTCEIMPANTQKRATNQRYVFSNLSTGQRYKSFAWHNEPFEEINFHYPSQSTGEVDTICRYNITDQTYANDVIDRTAAEVPYAIAFYPMLASFEGGVYSHEYGNDANGQSLPFTFRTNLKNAGKREVRLSRIIPDNVQSGTITLTVRCYQWPQSTSAMQTLVFQVTSQTDQIPIEGNARYWSYEFSGDELGQSFDMGAWQEEVQVSGDGP